MIVSVTRDPRDVAAIQRSGVRATLAGTVSDGLQVAMRPDVRLIVCDLASEGLDHRLIASLRRAPVPCPVILRHDLDRRAIDVLYEVARVDADVRPSFRGYDDLRGQLESRNADGDPSATQAILRHFPVVPDPRVRDFIAVMAVLGERPVMQARVASALAMSSSSFRSWLALLRSRARSLPPFPRLNAHFVALYVVWRRERLAWSGKRAAAASGFPDEQRCANYLRYHLRASSGQLTRAGGFDARMTVVRELFGTCARARNEAVRRI